MKKACARGQALLAKEGHGGLSHRGGGNQRELVGVEVKNGVSHSCRLAWQIAEIGVKGVRFPPKSKLDILLLDSSSMKSDTGTHPNGMRRKPLQSLGFGDIVYCRGGMSKSVIDVRRPNEVRHARRKAGIREDGQWV